MRLKFALDIFCFVMSFQIIIFIIILMKLKQILNIYRNKLKTNSKFKMYKRKGKKEKKKKKMKMVTKREVTCILYVYLRKKKVYFNTSFFNKILYNN